jgi:type VII secretion-associated serine protease mycosin
MLSQNGRRRPALLAPALLAPAKLAAKLTVKLAMSGLVVFCAIALAALPGTARAAEPRTASAAAIADAIRDNQEWVFGMLNVTAAWPRSEGAGVTVAVIDSGVDPYVSDLIGSVTTGPDFTGVSTAPASQNWGVHGTWMASLIAGHGHGGGSGVLGVAPRARILSIRVIPDRTDPHYSRYEREQEASIQQSLANGINYAVARGAQVISMSIGYSAPSGTVRAALQRAYDRGVVVLASAGNSGDQAGSGRSGQAPESFPADYPGVISVGAVDSRGRVASFSSANLSVQVAAPGVSVPAQGRDGQYWWVSGTSPACALVAGVAALIKSKYPHLAPDLVATALTTTTTDRPPGGYDSQVGFGVVDATAALTKAAQLAHAPPVGATPAGTSSSGTTRGPVGAAAAARFHGTIPPAPVPARGPGQLIGFALLALASLALAGVAGTRLAFLRRARR